MTTGSRCSRHPLKRIGHQERIFSESEGTKKKSFPVRSLQRTTLKGVLGCGTLDLVTSTPSVATRDKPPHVVILGGGFAGLRVALELSKRARPDEVTITLVDREDVHVNPVWLYEVATALNPFEREAVGTVLHQTASVPFAHILGGSRVVFLRRIVADVDVAAGTVRFTTGEAISAAYLVLALGSQSATFRVPGVESNAFSIKTLHEAVELRYHLVRQFLRYRSASRERQKRAFRVTVVGGGATGVELAAELALFLQRLAITHRVEEHLPSVVLFEAGDQILREFPSPLRTRGLRRLRELGIQVMTKTEVCVVGPGHLSCPDGTVILADTLVWLAGVKAHDLLLRSGLPVHPRGGVKVEPTLEVSGVKNVFAAGDCVFAVDAVTGKVSPDVAHAAIQQGAVVAHNILRRLRGQSLISYLDRARPMLATVGGKFALVHLPPFQFAGRLGWILKQLVDLRYLFSILPNDLAIRAWLRGVKVRVANDWSDLRTLS